MNIKSLFGDKAFYKMVMLITIPIIVQNGITSFVSLLDNIMVGRLGTAEMTGVAISNQLMMIYQLCIFGATSGAGIFGAQFFGNKDLKGVRNVMRFKFISGVLISLIFIIVFAAFADPLLNLFLKGEGTPEQIAQTLHFGKVYMFFVLIQLVPFSIIQTYASSLRECGETVVPMKAGIVAVLTNLIGDYILIFGSFGAPKLGVVGAAVATDIARLVELAYILVWIYKDKNNAPYARGIYSQLFNIPKALTKDIIKKGAPLMLNEYLWAQGQAVISQCLSLRGIIVIAAVNINFTISNMFMVVCMSMGSAISIIVGQLMGANKMKEAKDTDKKLIMFAIILSLIVSAALVVVAPLFPQTYDTEPEVKALATKLIWITAFCMPLWSFCNACYFTLRSGGKTIITFIFDSAFVWVGNIPVAFLLSRFTAMPIVPLFFCANAIDVIKCVIGFIMVKKGIWLNNIVEDKS